MEPKQPPSPRRRLQELLAIPESERTDAQWDELVELEISLAPGNRLDGGGGPRPNGVPSSSAHKPNKGKRPHTQAKKPPRPGHGKPKRPSKPPV